jgi:hypothetical protein
MPRMTKLSITMPADLLLLARSSIQRPGETRSAMFARLVAEALDRAYADGYARLPVTPEEGALGDLLGHQLAADVQATERVARTRPARRRRPTRAAG